LIFDKIIALSKNGDVGCVLIQARKGTEPTGTGQ
jgi:hypothetical protein